MVIFWHVALGPTGPARPRIGHPKRDRAKVKSKPKGSAARTVNR